MAVEWRPLTRRELFLLAALLVPLAITAVVVAQVPLAAYGNADPRAFVARSIDIATTWTTPGELPVTVRKDPPLRYAPLAVVYALVEPSHALANAIGAAYGALAVLVAAPLSVWAFFRTVASPCVALCAVAALVVD